MNPSTSHPSIQLLHTSRPRSGDVGIGLNARRMRTNFLNRFTVTYSLRPVGDIGTVFRRYPGLWKVFVEEPDLPGRWAVLCKGTLWQHVLLLTPAFATDRPSG